MKVKILKSAGVIVKNDVMVVQIGKVIDLNKSLASHLIKNKIAEPYEDQEEIQPEPLPETPEEDVNVEQEETEVE